jgi:hypothetical protein
MKTLLAVIFAAGLIGCANANPPDNVTVANTHYPYDRYSTTTEVSGATSPAYAKWTTERLQKRRLDLYATVPRTETGNGFQVKGVPIYTVRGMPLPQQDEIKAIEVELNKRYKAGDKSAELKEAWPRNRRHP